MCGGGGGGGGGVVGCREGGGITVSCRKGTPLDLVTVNISGSRRGQ